MKKQMEQIWTQCADWSQAQLTNRSTSEKNKYLLVLSHWNFEVACYAAFKLSNIQGKNMRQSLDGYRLEKVNGAGMWSKELEE